MAVRPHREIPHQQKKNSAICKKIPERMGTGTTISRRSQLTAHHKSQNPVSPKSDTGFIFYRTPHCA
jgi:hypothetical protein